MTSPRYGTERPFVEDFDKNKGKRREVVEIAVDPTGSSRGSMHLQAFELTHEAANCFGVLDQPARPRRDFFLSLSSNSIDEIAETTVVQAQDDEAC